MKQTGSLLFLLVTLFFSAQSQNPFQRLADNAWDAVQKNIENPTEAYAAAPPLEKKAREYSNYAGILIDSFNLEPVKKNLPLLIEAKRFLNTALKLDSTLAVTNTLMGNTCIQLDSDYTAATFYYLRNLRNDPDNFDAAFNMGIVRQHQERYEEALQYFFLAEKNERRGTHALPLLGETCFLMDSIDLAIDYYKRAVDADSKDDYAAYKLGIIYGKKKGDLPACIEMIERAIQINPNRVSYYEDLGVAYGFNSQFNEAKQVFEKALKLFPDYAPLYANLYVTYKNMNEIKKAKEALKKAKALDPAQYGDKEF